MTVARDGNTLKQFKATCPVSKQLVAWVYSRATANGFTNCPWSLAFDDTCAETIIWFAPSTANCAL